MRVCGPTRTGFDTDGSARRGRQRKPGRGVASTSLTLRPIHGAGRRPGGARRPPAPGRFRHGSLRSAGRVAPHISRPHLLDRTPGRRCSSVRGLSRYRNSRAWGRLGCLGRVPMTRTIPLIVTTGTPLNFPPKEIFPPDRTDGTGQMADGGWRMAESREQRAESRRLKQIGCWLLAAGRWRRTQSRSRIADSQHPTPDTRHPDPGTRNPEPGTRNPEPGTRNPEPEPETRNPKPETRNPKPASPAPHGHAVCTCFRGRCEHATLWLVTRTQTEHRPHYHANTAQNACIALENNESNRQSAEPRLYCKV